MIFKSTKKAILILSGIVLVVSLNACSSYSTRVSDNNIAIERVNSKSVKITRAKLYSTGINELYLRGELKRRISHKGKVPGHLHVKLVNLKGVVFKEAKFNYKRKNSHSSISKFSIPINSEPKLISAVHVIHHDLRAHVSDTETFLWNNVREN